MGEAYNTGRYRGLASEGFLRGSKSAAQNKAPKEGESVIIAFLTFI